MSDKLPDDLYLDDLELLLRNVDVSDNPGIFWTLIGTAAVLSFFAVAAVWRLLKR